MPAKRFGHGPLESRPSRPQLSLYLRMLAPNMFGGNVIAGGIVQVGDDEPGRLIFWIEFHRPSRGFHREIALTQRLIVRRQGRRRSRCAAPISASLRVDVIGGREIRQQVPRVEVEHVASAPRSGRRYRPVRH